jgi:hypothetical protein
MQVPEQKRRADGSHALRIVLNETQCHKGVILSRVGFQKGAIAAATASGPPSDACRQVETVVPTAPLPSLARQLLRSRRLYRGSLSECSEDFIPTWVVRLLRRVLQTRHNPRFRYSADQGYRRGGPWLDLRSAFCC